jgi:hypothetical protein
LIESIKTAANVLQHDEPTISSEDQEIRMNSLKRMQKSTTLAMAVIKAVGANIYNQWHPSPTLPGLPVDFDATDETQLEDYMVQVNKFLNDLCTSNVEKNGPQNGPLTKLAKGVKTIATHVSPFVKLAIKLGKESGLTVSIVTEGESLTNQVPVPYGVICSALDLLFQVNSPMCLRLTD